MLSMQVSRAKGLAFAPSRPHVHRNRLHGNVTCYGAAGSKGAGALACASPTVQQLQRCQRRVLRSSRARHILCYSLVPEQSEVTVPEVLPEGDVSSGGGGGCVLMHCVCMHVHHVQVVHYVHGAIWCIHHAHAFLIFVFGQLLLELMLLEFRGPKAWHYVISPPAACNHATACPASRVCAMPRSVAAWALRPPATR